LLEIYSIEIPELTFPSHFVIMADTIPKSHRAVVAVGKGVPLELLEFDTPQPIEDQVLVKVSWVTITPLNLHRVDGGLLLSPPQILSGGYVGTVLALGPNVKKGLKPGDQVFGFGWAASREMPWQEYVVSSERIMGKVPDGYKDAKALTTVPDSFVTAWHTCENVLGLDIPWPKPEGFKPKDANKPVLVWGGSGSVGMYVIPLLKWAGYENIVATASQRHHEMLKNLGATSVVDYRDPNVIQELIHEAGSSGYKHIVDCIGSYSGSVKPITELANNGSAVAIMLPIFREESRQEESSYIMDVNKELESGTWKYGVKAFGVRTHFYLQVRIYNHRILQC
jgi:NADPH:quinone reductase-like Zn-dependent oxidoreductase